MEVITKRPDILERQVGSEYMLYDAAGRKVHVLNATAYFVWGLCDGTRDMDAMVREAGGIFAASPEHLNTDIQACLEEFRTLGLLEWHE